MSGTRENRIADLLQAVHAARQLDVYEYAEEHWSAEPGGLAAARARAAELVTQRLARWVDPPHTTLELTPFGRYWMSAGGYLAFLRDGDDKPAGRGRGDREGSGMDPVVRGEYDRLRMELMKKRLQTFWWGFGVSIVSLIVSLVSFWLAMRR